MKRHLEMCACGSSSHLKNTHDTYIISVPHGHLLPCLFLGSGFFGYLVLVPGRFFSTLCIFVLFCCRYNLSKTLNSALQSVLMIHSGMCLRAVAAQFGS